MIYQCLQCGKQFKKGSDLTCHLEGPHSAAGSAVFQCRDGHHETPRKDNYKRHLSICRKKHTSNEPFSCRCGGEDTTEKVHAAHISVCKYKRGYQQSSCGDDEEERTKSVKIEVSELDDEEEEEQSSKLMAELYVLMEVIEAD